jgi:hypothetical protein
MKLNVISFYWAAKGTRNRKKWQDFPFSVPFSAICQSCTAVNSRSLLLALTRPATQSGGLEGILPGVAALPLRGVSLPTATRFIAVDTGSSRSGGWWRGGEATVGVVPDVALVSGAAVSLHCELLG